jgi:hypothetical protein
MPRYEIKPEHGAAQWWICANGVKHRNFMSKTGAEAYLTVQRRLDGRDGGMPHLDSPRYRTDDGNASKLENDDNPRDAEMDR